jgi:UDP-N-acetyl-2-amino-2-deoxyglucuronate dehydrogenase
MRAPRYFALTGAAGFVAPRHLKAIKDTGSELVAALRTAPPAIA